MDKKDHPLLDDKGDDDFSPYAIKVIDKTSTTQVFIVDSGTASGSEQQLWFVLNA